MGSLKNSATAVSGDEGEVRQIVLKERPLADDVGWIR
jgi:hypothetical protein